MDKITNRRGLLPDIYHTKQPVKINTPIPKSFEGDVIEGIKYELTRVIEEEGITLSNDLYCFWLGNCIAVANQGIIYN
jgi:hypothetical protein